MDRESSADAIEAMLFDHDEPWRDGSASFQARRSVALALADPVSDSNPTLSQAVSQAYANARAAGPDELAMAQQGIERLLASGPACARWLAEGGTLKVFEAQRLAALGSAKNSAELCLGAPRDTGSDALAIDWIAEQSARARALADGPLRDQQSSDLFWRALSAEPSPSDSSSHALFFKKIAALDHASPHSASEPPGSKSFIETAYFSLSALRLPKPGQETATTRLAHDIERIVFAPQGGLASGPDAQRACSIAAQAAWLAGSEDSRCREASASLMASSRESMLLSSGADARSDQVFDRISLQGSRVGAWLLSGHSRAEFEIDQKKLLPLARDLADEGLPRRVGASPEESSAFERAWSASVEAAARAHALSRGPLLGSDPMELMAYESPALQGSTAQEASALGAMRHSAFSIFKSFDQPPLSERALALVVGALSAIGAAALGQPLRLGAAYAHALLGARSGDTESAIAARVQSRFGFASVLADGMGPGLSLRKSLLKAERDMAEACERLGIDDFELGRRGASCFVLSGSLALKSGYSGSCSADNGNITLCATSSDASMIAHEWAHSVDGLVGKAMGAPLGFCATEYASISGSRSELAELARDLSRSLLSEPEPDRARAALVEEGLGRLACAKLAAAVLGRPAWAALAQGARQAYLDASWQAGLGVACGQAREIDAAMAAARADAKSERLAPGAYAERVAQNAKLAEEGKGGYLGACARELSESLRDRFGADARQASALCLGQGLGDHMSLGLMVLREGSARFDEHGKPRVIAKARSAYDAVCSAMDAFASHPTLPDYWKSPHEMLARAVERATASGVDNSLTRLLVAAFAPSGSAQAQRFKRDWHRFLSAAGIQGRPGGMKLSAPALGAAASCVAALARPLAHVVDMAGALSERVNTRRAVKALLQTAPAPSKELKS